MMHHIRQLTTAPALSPREQFLRDVCRGLERRPRTLPCKYFYDERGSDLFEQICELDEYYVTRTELGITQRYAAEMAAAVGDNVRLVEFGSGSSLKSQILLDHVRLPAAYVPVDISSETLHRSAERIRQRHPGLEVLPVCADFTKRIRVPQPVRTPRRTVIYFPGSTIGNFGPRGVEKLLKGMARVCGKQGGLLIGVDLKKNRSVLERAYNDARGVTRDFNLNLLVRMNRELGADFDLDGFEHRAPFNERAGRIEMQLVSRRSQCVQIGEFVTEFEPGEFIRTECSYKYEIGQFARLASRAGWRLRQVWTDDERWFSVQYLTVV